MHCKTFSKRQIATALNNSSNNKSDIVVRDQDKNIFMVKYVELEMGKEENAWQISKTIE